MAKWIIREPRNIKKIIKRLGSPEKKRYISLLEDFRNSEDPAKFAQETEMLGSTKIFIARLNNSYRTKYTILRADNIIIILSVGDHKEVGLREK